MQATVAIPKAFSVRNDQEFYPIQHLMARMNPKLIIGQVATGMHVNGGCTVFWGLAYLADKPPSPKDVEAALREAGFDFAHGTIQEVALPNARLTSGA